MKKSSFVAMILGTIGGILFALGICMTLIAEWNARQPGIVLGVLGVVVLLIMLLVWRKMENKEYGVPILCSFLLPLQFLLVSYHAVRRIHLIANCPYNPLLLTAFQTSH